MIQPITTEYEFTATENQTIDDLAGKMRFVGLMSVILSVLVLGAAGVGLVFGGRGMTGQSLGNVLQGVMMMFVGVWTRSAAHRFQRIVDTQGHDISNLMRALEHLGRIYSLQRVLYLLVGVGFVLAIQLSILTMTRGVP
jgi:hypothetical protein